MTLTKTRTAVAKTTRSPELERLIRALGQVATDLPRILREEKATAFSRLESVEAFEAHMREVARIPFHLEALSSSISRSLQVNGATDHLSRLFRAIATARGVEPPVVETPVVETPEPSAIRHHPLPVARHAQPASPAIRKDKTDTAAMNTTTVTDPGTGDIRGVANPQRFHPADLNLDQVRSALVPGGEVCGRSMFESSRARLMTARAAGEGPWRFQFRRGSLEWAAKGEEDGLRGVAALICGDLGYVSVPARLLLERAGAYLMRSTGGNPVLRPSVAVYGAEAILHPGAMARTRPGDATKHVFVEF
jgi:hypothetical protein